MLNVKSEEANLVEEHCLPWVSNRNLKSQISNLKITIQNSKSLLILDFSFSLFTFHFSFFIALRGVLPKAGQRGNLRIAVIGGRDCFVSRFAPSSQ